MQRASATSSPTTPNAPSASIPPSPKRQKLSNHSTATTPNLQNLRHGQDIEEARIQAAIDRVAAERGETKWSFESENSAVNGDLAVNSMHNHSIAYLGLNVAQASWSDIDGRQAEKVGRRTYGVVKQTEKRSLENAEDSSTDMDSSDDEEGQEETLGGVQARYDWDEDNAAVADLIANGKDEEKSGRKAARKAEKAAKKKRKKELEEMVTTKKVKLSKLTSISGTQGAAGTGREKGRDVECFVCGENGHRKAECPKRDGKKRGRREREKMEELNY